VSKSNLEQVKQSIAGQEEQHPKIGSQGELRALLQNTKSNWTRNLSVLDPPGHPYQSPLKGCTRIKDHQQWNRQVLRCLSDFLSPKFETQAL